MKKSKKTLSGILTLIILCAGLFGVYSYQDTEDSDSTMASPSLYTWDESAAPNYYLVIGEAETRTDIDAGEIETSELDSLGRTGGVYAVVTYDMVEESAGWREDIPESEDPAGWGHNEKCSIETPDGETYNGYFWNRSHLLADSLGGHAVQENLITGTRMQNVGGNDNRDPGGMAYTETKARNWIYDHTNGTIYYSAIPNYKGDELVPRSVTVNIKTSDGSIDEQVLVYNAAKGYTIDYSNGTFQKTE